MLDKLSALAFYQRRHLIYHYVMAEEVGFEPTDGSHRQTISSRSRYDHFDTPPYMIMMIN